MSRRLTNERVATLKAKAGKRTTYPDPELRGHYVRVTPNGSKSFVVVVRDPKGKQHWVTVGQFPAMSIDDARDEARKRIKAIGKQEADPESFTAVAADWYQRHVIKNGLRSADELRRLMKRYLNDAWPGRSFVSIRRKDINHLLDGIEDHHGLRQADYVFSTVRQICNWYAVRDDNYVSPIVAGMRRRKSREHERRRILTDDEVRELWTATGDGSSYSRLVRFLLLTGQRREKVATMRWEDIDGAKWTIPTERREKGNAGVLVLPELALDALGECGEGYIFTSRTGHHITDWTGSKRRLDATGGSAVDF